MKKKFMCMLMAAARNSTTNAFTTQNNIFPRRLLMTLALLPHPCGQLNQLTHTRIACQFRIEVITIITRVQGRSADHRQHQQQQQPTQSDNTENP